MHYVSLLSLACLILSLAACGGGGGDTGNSEATANVPPIAVISAPANATTGDTVTLDGSASSDPDGRILRWQWEQTAGPPVRLSDASSPAARFTVPQINTETALVFSLRITDDDNLSATRQRTVTALPPASAQRFDIRGTVLVSAQQAVDGDTNDPTSPATSNDSIDQAQPLDNPVTLGGYVNQPGTGPDGRFRSAGDVDDYYRVELLAGQRITLLVATPEEGDADLYLLDEQGNIIDFSIDTAELEQVSAPADGRYVLNVAAFSGATNSTLAIGNQTEIAAQEGRLPIVTGEVIVDYQAESAAARLPDLAPDDLAWRMGMRQRAGGPGRARLLALQAAPEMPERDGDDAARAARIVDPTLRERWETLIPIKRLRGTPGVRSASPNYRLRPRSQTSDPALSLQWHYPLIDLPAAWDVTTGDRDVVIAVIDTGVLPAHPDLQGQLLPGYDFVADPQRAGDGDGIDPDPTDPGNRTAPGESRYHGTHVAGTVAATGNNGIGVAGVAYGARIMPLRALGEDGGTSYDLLQALRYAAGLPNDSGQVPARSADIINLSLGGEGFSEIARELYRQLWQAGVIVVAAAGNEGSSRLTYPAAYDGVIAVSGVDAQGEATAYSNRGIFVDVAAPGGDSGEDVAGDGYPDGVLSTSARGAGSSLDYSYSFASGTSMAAAHVSGILALMKSVNPALTPAAVENLLQRGELTRDRGPGGRDDRYGHGLINARKAVNAALLSLGETIDVAPRLTASSSALSFGSELRQLELVLGSSTTAVRVTEVASSTAWLQVRASDTDAQGLGTYVLNAERRGLAAGIYSAALRVRSTANDLQIPVQMAVGSVSGSDLGTLYVLLYHPATDVVVDSVAVRGESGRYPYRFDSTIAGSYHIYAGTDADNDLLICDPGEACGAWLTTEQPATLQLRSDRDDLDFPAGYTVSLPGTRSIDDTRREPPSLRREQ